jgi:hypothetical protein
MHIDPVEADGGFFLRSRSDGHLMRMLVWLSKRRLPTEKTKLRRLRKMALVQYSHDKFPTNPMLM